MEVTPAQRDDVIRRLHLAAADGRLGFDEADARIVAARSALAESDLAVLVHDLGPATRPSPDRAPASAPLTATDPPQPYSGDFEPYPVEAARASGPVSAVTEPGYSPLDPLVLSAGWEGVKRTGRWRVPPFIRASSGIDGVTIDCLLAQHTSQVIDLEVSPAAGSVTLIVPDGWGVQIDRLARGFGSAKSTVATDAAPGCPAVVVHGGVGLGSFRARHASRFQRWRLKRRGIVLPSPPRELR